MGERAGQDLKVKRRMLIELLLLKLEYQSNNVHFLPWKIMSRLNFIHAISLAPDLHVISLNPLRLTRRLSRLISILPHNQDMPHNDELPESDHVVAAILTGSKHSSQTPEIGNRE